MKILDWLLFIQVLLMSLMILKWWGGIGLNPPKLPKIIQNNLEIPLAMPFFCAII